MIPVSYMHIYLLLLTPQEVAEEPSTRSGLNRLVRQPVFRFFPSANVQIGQAGITKSNCQGQVGEKVDLNLKL